MNVRSLVPFLSAAVLASGCIISGNRGGSPPPPPAASGDVTFTWTFAGHSCADSPQVKSVVVSIPGETLQNNGVFPCTANNYPGIVLHDFAPGTYNYSLTAVGYGNETLFQSLGSFSVNGDVRVTDDLVPPGSPSSYAYLTWSFPPNSEAQDPTCLQAGVAFVDISIDGAPSARFDCTEGFHNSGVQTPYLAAGSHQIEIVALASNSYPYYRFSGTLQTVANHPVSSDYALNWAVGGTAVNWHLTNGSVGQTCGSAGVTAVYVNFQDSSGNWVYGQDGDAQACNASPIVYNYLAAGTYKVYVEAVTSGSAWYRSNTASPPEITVQAGAFVGPESAMMVDLYLQ